MTECLPLLVTGDETVFVRIGPRLYHLVGFWDEYRMLPTEARLMLVKARLQQRDPKMFYRTPAKKAIQ